VETGKKLREKTEKHREKTRKFFFKEKNAKNKEVESRGILRKNGKTRDRKLGKKTPWGENGNK